MQHGAGGGVAATVECARNFIRLHIGRRQQPVDKTAFAGAGWPHEQILFALQGLLEGVQGITRLLQRYAQGAVAHGAIRLQPLPGAGVQVGQVGFVQHDQRGNAGCFGSNQCPAQKLVRELRLCRQPNQYLVDIGGKSLGAYIVLPVKHIASGQNGFDRAFFALAGGGCLPMNPIAYERLVFFAARMANAAAAVWRFYHGMPPVAGNDQTFIQAGRQGV